MKNSKKAFTMVELVFVIAIVGILAAVAIPRLSATRDDAQITKARTLVASVRNALAMERQKRILRGEFKPLTGVGNATNVFGNFYDENGDTGNSVLEYPVPSVADTKDHWSFSAGTGKDGRDQYIFNSTLGDVAFEVVDGKFLCNSEDTANSNEDGCKTLTN